ncbi:MAG: hypothetical protein ABI183_09825 [Polyangiaceae bacterium]
MPVLVPCPSCARHVAVSESACPFCAGVLPTDLESRAIPGSNRRLSRLATFTFATTLVVGAAAACSSGSDETCCPPYGAPPPFDGSVQDDGGISTHYGLPGDADIFEDASPDDAASGDAGEDAD